MHSFVSGSNRVCFKNDIRSWVGTEVPSPILLAFPPGGRIGFPCDPESSVPDPLFSTTDAGADVSGSVEGTNVGRQSLTLSYHGVCNVSTRIDERLM